MFNEGDWIVRTSNKPFSLGIKAIMVETTRPKHVGSDRTIVNGKYEIENQFIKIVTAEEAKKINDDYAAAIQPSLVAEAKKRDELRKKRTLVNERMKERKQEINNNPQCWNKLSRKKKMKFSTKEKADAYILRHFDDNNEMNSYLCGSCNEWHIGRNFTKDVITGNAVKTILNNYYGMLCFIMTSLSIMTFVISSSASLDIVVKIILQSFFTALFLLLSYALKNEIINENSKRKLDNKKEREAVRGDESEGD